MAMGSGVIKVLESTGVYLSQAVHGISQAFQGWGTTLKALTAAAAVAVSGGDPRPPSTLPPVVSTSPAASQPPPQLKVRKPSKGEALPNKYAALVKRGDQILYAVNADAPLDAASLMKILTAFVVAEAIDTGKLKTDQDLTVSRHAAMQTGSVLGLRAGHKIKVHEALALGLLGSFNDAIVVVAEGVEQAYGTQPDPRDPTALEKAFAKRMTKTAQELGAFRTKATTATGLEDGTTTAEDILRIAAALKRDHFKVYSLLSGGGIKYKGTSYETHIHLLSHHRIEFAKTGTKTDNYSFYGDEGETQYTLIGLKDPGARYRFATMFLESVKATNKKPWEKLKGDEPRFIAVAGEPVRTIAALTGPQVK